MPRRVPFGRGVSWSRGWRKFTRLWRTDTVLSVDEELRFHFEQKVAEFELQGMTAADARAQAETEFGDLRQVRESLYVIDARVAHKRRRAEWWESVAQDLRYVVRSLGRSPVFTITVVLTLALGLGANTAILGVLDRLYFRPTAAVPKPHELRRLYHRSVATDKGTTFSRFNINQLEPLRALAPTGIILASYTAQLEASLGRGLDAPKGVVNFVEGDYFGVAGVRPVLGRVFAPEETRLQTLAMVAVISDNLWRRMYDRDPAIVGKTIDLGSHRHQIIGVAQGGFRGFDLDATDVWVPMSTRGVLRDRPANWMERRRTTLDTRVVARVTNAGAVQVFDARATAELRTGQFKDDSLPSTFLGPFIEARAGQVTQIAITTRLAGVAAVILLIACANVANLMLARASSRKREIAVRIALGVSRKRLFLQLVAESTALAIFAGAVAILVAATGTTVLRKLLMPAVKWGEGTIDGRMIALTAIIALLTGCFIGLVPALLASKSNLSSALKSGVRDGGSRHATFRKSLLIVQAAMSVVLLVGAGVFVSSMRHVEAVDLGYDVNRLLFAEVNFDRELGDHREEIIARLPQAADALRRLPGVEKVALTYFTPLYSFTMEQLHLPNQDSMPSAGTQPRVMSVVSANFFETVGMHVEQGRLLTDTDRGGSEPVLVMNREMAKNLWPGENALGKCLIVGERGSACRRVVGIVSHAHFDGVIEDRAMQYYLPLEQYPKVHAEAIAIRARPGTSAAALGNVVRHQLADEYGAWARPVVRVMRDLVEPDLQPWRVGAALFTAAGLLALLVAALGIYSSIAYTLSQRTQELGIRIALGADSRIILKLVLGEGVRVIALGISLGMLIAFALGSLVAAVLYDTSPRDPWVMAGSAATLLLVTVAACSIPAWRASRVDPLTALRAE